MTREDSIKRFIGICKNNVTDYMKCVYEMEVPRKDILLNITDATENIIEALARIDIFEGVYFKFVFDINGMVVSVNVYRKADSFVNKLNEESVEAIINFIQKE